MKILAFGSCLSNLVANNLVMHFGGQKIGNVAHNRSDAFVSYVVEGRPGYPTTAEFHARFKPYPEYVEAATQIHDNQVLENIGRHEAPEGRGLLPELAEPIDLILMDNFMDLAAKLLEFDSYTVFCNDHHYEENLFEHALYVDFLTPEESAANWLRIYQWVRERQPGAKIIFLGFPFDTDPTHGERYERGRLFNEELEAIRPDGLDFFPSLCVPAEHTRGPQDWAHYEERVYLALAGQVFLSMINHPSRLQEAWRPPVV